MPLYEDLNCETKEEAMLLLDSLASIVGLTDKDVLVKLTSKLYVAPSRVYGMKIEEFPTYEGDIIPHDANQTTLDSYTFIDWDAPSTTTVVKE